MTHKIKTKEECLMAKEFKCNEVGKCPLCGNEIDYLQTNSDECGFYYDWNCMNKRCNAVGKEFYNITLSTHGNVQNKNGKEVLNDEGY